MSLQLGTTNTDDQLLSQYSKILVYGDSGVGKTRLISTCTPDDPSKTLIISAENKLISLRGSGIPVHQVNSFREFLDVITELEKNTHGFEWIAIDSISELAQMSLDDANKGNAHGMAAYGVMFEQVMPAIRRCQKLDVNIYYICQQKTEKDAKGNLSIGLRLAGKALPEKLPYDFDEIFHLAATMQGGETVRMIQTIADGKVAAKDGSGNLAAFVFPDLAEIHAKILEDEATREDLRKKKEEEERIAEVEVRVVESDKLKEVVAGFDKNTADRFIASCLVYWKVNALVEVPSGKLRNFVASLRTKEKAGTLHDSISGLIQKYPGVEPVAEEPVEAIPDEVEPVGILEDCLAEYDRVLKDVAPETYELLRIAICSLNKVDDIHDLPIAIVKQYANSLRDAADLDDAISIIIELNQDEIKLAKESEDGDEVEAEKQSPKDGEE